MKKQSHDKSRLFISGYVEGIVFDENHNELCSFRQKNLVVATAKTSLATAFGGGVDPFDSVPTIKLGTSDTAEASSQTDLISPVNLSTAVLVNRSSSGSTAEVTYTFSHTSAVTIKEAGLFFGSTMWSRVVLSTPILIPSGGYYTHTWKITFSS